MSTFTREVVSPELALVDAELALRARIVRPAPWAAERALAMRVERAVHASPVKPPARRGKLLWQGIVPTLVIATMAASILGPGTLRPVVRSGELSGSDAPAQAAQQLSAAPSVARPRQTLENGRVEPTSRQRVGRSMSSATQIGVERRSVTGVSTWLAPKLRGWEAGAFGAISPAVTLFWGRAPSASSYDIELVRGHSRIFAARSRSSQVIVPRSWRHGGVTFGIRPEDQAYVWPIIDGRRAARPVVNGTLALDLTLVASYRG